MHDIGGDERRPGIFNGIGSRLLCDLRHGAGRQICHACGEDAAAASDLRLIGFMRRSMSAVFDLDSRLLRTFRALICRPGFLTAEYVRGSHRPYLTPLQTFLMANLLFFISLATMGGVTAFTTPLKVHRLQPFYGSAAGRLMDAQGRPGTAERIEYERRFDEASPRYANTLVILLRSSAAVKRR